jgi:hypothetical protein
MKKLESLKSKLFQSDDLMSRKELNSNQGGKEIATTNDDSTTDVYHSNMQGGSDVGESRPNKSTGDGDAFIVNTACSNETDEDVNADSILAGGLDNLNPAEIMVNQDLSHFSV